MAGFVTDRTRQTDRQLSDRIGEPFYKQLPNMNDCLVNNVNHVITATTAAVDIIIVVIISNINLID